MHRLTQLSICTACLGLALGACESPTTAPTSDAEPPVDSGAAAVSAPRELDLELVPLPGKEGEAPQLTQAQVVLFETTAGNVMIEVYPEAAPNAAQRFVELVESGFYDNIPISRVVPGFVAQFGINWREPHRAWQNRNFDDDPTLFALERGTLAFAKAGPNTNSTQVFINYIENNRLADPQYNFTVFGKIVDGMDVVGQFVQVGDPSGGLNQPRLWSDGDTYLESLEVQPTMIVNATVL